jgi:putative transposase
MTKQDNYIRANRSVYLLTAHIVFVTKYRKSVLTLPIIERLDTIFKETCLKWDSTLKEFNGENNHVHLLVQYPPDVALAKMIANLKTVSSRLIRKEFDEIRSAYRKPVLWTASYFVTSCGGVTIETLQKYVQGRSESSSRLTLSAISPHR